MRATIDGAIRQLGVTTLLIAMATALLATSFWVSDEVISAPILMAFSTGALLSGHGVHMVSDRPRFNTSEPWGMLGAFSPPIHPALLNRPFTDVIRAHIDPLLAVRISQYLGALDSKIHEHSSRRELQETLLHLLYLRRSSLIDEEQFRSALEPMVDSSTIEGLFSHHDRIRMRRDGGRGGDGIWLDVDMENLVVGQANLFAFVLNEGDVPRDVVLRVQTPDFRPNECVYSLRIDPLSLDSEGNFADTPSSLLGMISATSIVWQSLLPSAMGEATVTVRLEDDAGNLISGRVLTVQVRSDLLTRIKMTLGGLFMVGAAIVVLSPMLPFLLNLLGL